MKLALLSLAVIMLAACETSTAPEPQAVSSNERVNHRGEACLYLQTCRTPDQWAAAREAEKRSMGGRWTPEFEARKVDNE